MGFTFPYTTTEFTYTGFHRFRRHVGLELELSLDEMAGYTGASEEEGLDWETVLDDNDSIRLLLDMSDVDGRIATIDCLAVSKRLQEIIQNWEDDTYDFRLAQVLIDSLNACDAMQEAFVMPELPEEKLTDDGEEDGESLFA